MHSWPIAERDVPFGLAPRFGAIGPPHCAGVYVASGTPSPARDSPDAEDDEQVDHHRPSLVPVR